MMEQDSFTCLSESGWTSELPPAISREKVPQRTIVIPALTNLHSHAFQYAMAGLSERRGRSSDDDFWSWRETMYQFLDQMTPDDIEVIAAQAYAQMLEAGFGHVVEFHYLHHDPVGKPYANPAETAGRIIAAAKKVGIGLTLLPVFYAHAHFGGALPVWGQRRFVCDLDQFAKIVKNTRELAHDLPGTVVGVAPHSLRAALPEEIGEVVKLAGEGPIHTHAAEQTREVEESIRHLGAPPVQYLLDHFPVDRRWCFIHATHATPWELREVARRKAVVGLCPLTEANLGDGIFAATDYLKVGGRFGVGTDSNILLDAAGELRALESSQRLHLRKRNLLASPEIPSVGRTLFMRAKQGGEQAAGIVDAESFVVLDGDHPAFLARSGDALLDSWIFAAAKSPIREVYRGGKQLVEGGKHLLSEELHAAYRQVLQRLRG